MRSGNRETKRGWSSPRRRFIVGQLFLDRKGSGRTFILLGSMGNLRSGKEKKETCKLAKRDLKDILEEGESEEEVRKEVQDLLRGVRATTKKGGYEEIPEELILEQAERVGLSKEEIPKIRMADVRGGSIERTPEGKVEIILPRREPKWKTPDTLRHELAHYKLGHIGCGDEITWEQWIKSELEAQILQNGRLTSEALSSIVLTLVLEEGLLQSTAIRWVMEDARELGASEHSITSAKRWLRSHFKHLRELEEYV